MSTDQTNIRRKESGDQNEGCLKLTLNLCVFSEEEGRVADLRFHNY